jgi:AraC-like DNA-binding protein
MIIAALVWDPASRARLFDALKGQASLRYCDRQSELLSLVENNLAGVVVVDTRDREGSSTLNTVRHIREAYPSVPIVLYFAVSPDTSRDLLAFVRAGVNNLVLRDVDDLRHSLRTAMSTAADHCSARTIIEETGPLLPPIVMPMLRFCLENGRRSLSVEEVADALNVHRKTLVARLRGAHLPTPSALISWCRLLIAARLLEDPGRSVEQIALLLDFPSGTSMRNMMKRYTGLRPGEIRENGGVRCVLHAFKRTLTGGERIDKTAT